LPKRIFSQKSMSKTHVLFKEPLRESPLHREYNAKTTDRRHQWTLSTSKSHLQSHGTNLKIRLVHCLLRYGSTHSLKKTAEVAKLSMVLMSTGNSKLNLARLWAYIHASLFEHQKVLKAFYPEHARQYGDQNDHRIGATGMSISPRRRTAEKSVLLLGSTSSNAPKRP